MTYLDLLPIGRRINYKGLTYTVRALWNSGAVCRTDNGARIILEGAAMFEEVGPEAKFIFASGKRDAITNTVGERRFLAVAEGTHI